MGKNLRAFLSLLPSPPQLFHHLSCSRLLLSLFSAQSVSSSEPLCHGAGSLNARTRAAQPSPSRLPIPLCLTLAALSLVHLSSSSWLVVRLSGKEEAVKLKPCKVSRTP